jgi:alpha,alpha-trehalase
MTTAFVDYNGVVPEKFDVVKLSHLVDAEYGNQGLDFKLLNREGFAWTNCKPYPLARWKFLLDRLC